MVLTRLREAFKDKSWNYILLGGYDYKFLCMPSNPFSKTKRDPPQFFAPNAWLGLITAAIMGLQHAFAMVGGLITPPLLIAQLSANDPTLTQSDQDDLQQYMVSACLIITGIMTTIQVTGIPLPFGRQLGSGILSVMGISFTSYPIVTNVVTTLMARGHTFSYAYGHALGTIAICGIIPILISFMPIRALRKVFPPVVCGLTIMLIGINLTGTGMANWGGGSFCATYQDGMYNPIDGGCIINSVDGPVNTTSCYSKSDIMCSGNGDVLLPFGSGQYVGLGFSVFAFIIILEIFGSPFLRNVAVILALLFGYMMAGVTRADGERFVTGEKIAAAPAITFLWVHTFSLGVYGPSFLPFIIVFCITSIETVGDVTATEESSFLVAKGEAHNRRIRGALLNDGVSGIFSALATSMPLTTFAQNNGIIALTAVAARQAGWACAGWLFLMGVIGKIGGIITTIPNCVIGGMTTFLFANVISSGIRILVSDHLNRRNRFISACSFAIGIGVTLQPGWATNNLWPTDGLSSGVLGLRDAIITVLETGFTIAAVIAIILNLILPQEKAMIAPEPPSEDPSITTTVPSVIYAPKDHLYEEGEDRNGTGDDSLDGAPDKQSMERNSIETPSDEERGDKPFPAAQI